MFDDFLDSLNDKERVETINKQIQEFADGIRDLDPKDCKHFESREKIGIPDANVVVYYDVSGNDWTLISGLEWHPRVA